MSTDPTRRRAAETRLALVEDYVARHDKHIEAIEIRQDEHESRMDVLVTKVGIMAAIGAAIGGGVLATVSGLVIFLVTR